MKLLFKSFVAFCLLAFSSVGLAQGTPTTFYYGSSPSGPFTGFEINISGTGIYGSAFLRGGTDTIYFYNGSGVDRAGNLHGSFSGAIEGTFTGKVLGNGVSFTLKSRKGTVTLLGVKGSAGNAYASIAGKYGYFYFNDPSHNNSNTYVGFSFYTAPLAYFEIYHYSDGSETYGPTKYTFKKTGPNTATVTVVGAGTFTLTFTASDRGTITGPNVNGAAFYLYDFSDD